MSRPCLLLCLAIFLTSPDAPSDPLFVLKGTVTDAAGKAADGATVWLSQDRVVHKAAADANGAFAFSGVAPGPVEVVAYKKGACIDGLDARVVGDATVTLTLGEPDALQIKVLNQAHGAIEGARVKTMAVAGRFHVSVEDLAELGFPSPRSDEKGLLRVEALPKGKTVSVVVAHRDYAENRFPPLPVTEKPLPIVLYPGVKLRGRVLAPDKAPLAHARVSVFRLGARGQKEFAEGLTDPEGFFNVTVRAGSYFVAAHHAKYGPPDPQPVELTDKDEANVDITLLPARTVKGKVTGPKGEPAAAIDVVYIMGTSVREQTVTINDGSYVLHVPAGEGKLRVLPPDGYIPENPVDTTLKLENEAEVEVAPIKLVALPEIAGVVLNAEGAPEPGALVSSLDLNPACWTVTGADGAFRIQLPRVPFEHTATFRAEHGRRFLRADFKVSFDKLVPVKAQLKKFEPDTSGPRRDRIENNLQPLVGKPAPEWACKAWFNTNGVTLKDLRGKIVVLTLWGGFDTIGPGKDRISELNALYEVFNGADDVTFVGIHDGGTDQNEVKTYLENYKIRYPVGVDSDPYVTFGLYDTSSIPQTVLIDKAGVVRHFDVTGRLLELIKSMRRDG